MPLSSDPHKRARQLANLQAGAGAGDGGLQRAKTHGGFARVAAADLELETKRVFDALAQDTPVRAADGGLPREDTLAVSLLAETLVQLRDVSGFLLRRGLEDEAGDLRPANDLRLRLRNQAMDFADRLGCSPAARAKLGLDLARAQSAKLGDIAAELAEAEDASGEHRGDVLDGDATVVTVESIDAVALPADGELPDVEGDEHVAAAHDVLSDAEPAS